MLQNVTWFLVGRAALRAQDRGLGGEGIRCDGGAATLAGAAQLMQPLQVSALAFPVSDGIADELESGNTAEIGDREDRVEHRLKAGVFALLRKHVHLEEPFVGILLYLDEIGDLDRSPDLRKIRSFPRGVRFGFRHFIELLLKDNKLTCGRTTPFRSAGKFRSANFELRIGKLASPNSKFEIRISKSFLLST